MLCSCADFGPRTSATTGGDASCVAAVDGRSVWGGASGADRPGIAGNKGLANLYGAAAHRTRPLRSGQISSTSEMAPAMLYV
jgi:hypothetical protein